MNTTTLTVEAVLELALSAPSPAAEYWRLGRVIAERADKPEDRDILARGPEWVPEWAQDAAKDQILANIHRAPSMPTVPPNPGLDEPSYRYTIVQGLCEHIRPTMQAACNADPEYQRLKASPDHEAAFERGQEIQRQTGYAGLYELQMHAEMRLIEWGRDTMRREVGDARFAAVADVFEAALRYRHPGVRQQVIALTLKLKARS